MAMSIYHEAHSRNLAAALAGMRRNEDVMHAHETALSLSPPMSANNSISAMYPCLQQAANAVNTFGLLTADDMINKQRHAAAVLMAATQLPFNGILPHHSTFFNQPWVNAAAVAAGQNQSQIPLLTSEPHSPPASPESPLYQGSPIGSTTTGTVVTHRDSSSDHRSHTQSAPQQPTRAQIKHSHAEVDSGTEHRNEAPARKIRRLTVKKGLSSARQLDMINDIYHTPTTAPISPPSSGSSPISAHDSSSTIVAMAAVAVAASTAAAAANANTSAVPAAKDSSRDKSFTCKICLRSFGYKHVLQNHERTHTGEKPFECPECHKRFTRDHHLKTHMRLHTGEKPYHCDHCDRQFVQVANLRRHLRVHTGERPYTCEICEGKFSDSNQLKSHMLVHNGEKPFECDRCHMKFRRRHHLLNHKCGIQSPPTPAHSPLPPSSEYTMCDQKSALGSSYGSEESIDQVKVTPTNPNAITAPSFLMSSMASSYINYDAHIDEEEDLDDDEEDDGPLDLSEDNASASSMRYFAHRAEDIHRVFSRLPANIMAPIHMPEQTEPEDLSMPRSDLQSLSPIKRTSSSSSAAAAAPPPPPVATTPPTSGTSQIVRQQNHLSPLIVGTPMIHDFDLGEWNKESLNFMRLQRKQEKQSEAQQLEELPEPKRICKEPL